MISAVGGGMGMPSMDAMLQMQQKMFSKADANGSGGLDAAEFESMVKNSPMAGKGPQGASPEDMFKKIDGDGNGELSQAEMEDAHKKMMERFQSTMQAFGQGGAASTGSKRSQDALDTLLQAIGNGDGKDGKRDNSAQAVSTTDDLVAQLRGLIDKVSSTYSSAGYDTTHSLMVAA
jgi:EF hand